MKYTLISLGILSLFVLFACGGQEKSEEKEKQTQIAETAPTATAPSMAAGFKNLESNCFSCHNPNPAAEMRLAPTLSEIKQAYVTEGTSYQAFEQAIISFVNEPAENNVKMPEALAQYGPMPKFGYSESQLKAIANYIYHQPVESPEWFAKGYVEDKAQYKDWKPALSRIEQGKEFALKTKGVLGKNLLNAIKTKGTEGAVGFCNTRAIHLTDSMAQALHASVRRVSDKPRNPDNQADKAELAYILAAKELLSQGEKIKPQIQSIDGRDVAYYPIMTNDMCMQCHGKPETDIQANTLAKLSALYPEDQARGYGPNELRGIWVVGMDGK